MRRAMRSAASPVARARAGAAAVLLATVCAAAAAAAQPAAWGASRQAVVVVTDGWDAAGARVQLWERDAADAPWRPASEPMPATVGHAGLGWGRGLHARPEGGGLEKREGDGRAPAGVFRLPSAFGYAPGADLPWVRLPYAQATAASRCVDDPASRAYNRRVEADTVARPDWTSHEELRRADDRYRLAVWVDHNGDPPVPGGGSCIFLHVHGGPGVPTVGCTAFAPEHMERLLRWLDPAREPVLVQLPAAEYDRLRAAWELPHGG